MVPELVLAYIWHTLESVCGARLHAQYIMAWSHGVWLPWPDRDTMMSLNGATQALCIASSTAVSVSAAMPH